MYFLDQVSIFLDQENKNHTKQMPTLLTKLPKTKFVLINLFEMAVGRKPQH